MTRYEQVLDRLRGDIDLIRRSGTKGAKVEQYLRMHEQLLTAGPDDTELLDKAERMMNQSRDMSASVNRKTATETRRPERGRPPM